MGNDISSGPAKSNKISLLDFWSKSYKTKQFWPYAIIYHTRPILTHGLYIFYPVFHCGLYCRAVMLQTIYVLSKEILQFLGLKSAVYIRERFQIKSGLFWHTSMTSLLAHTVAQPTKWRFLPKNLNQLVIFVIELAFTWSWVNKNHQNLIFKVNFLCQ
jgi:hypothetical protein